MKKHLWVYLYFYKSYTNQTWNEKPPCTDLILHVMMKPPPLDHVTKAKLQTLTLNVCLRFCQQSSQKLMSPNEYPNVGWTNLASAAEKIYVHMCAHWELTVVKCHFSESCILQGFLKCLHLDECIHRWYYIISAYVYMWMLGHKLLVYSNKSLSGLI